jgi:hypothetical protein
MTDLITNSSDNWSKNGDFVSGISNVKLDLQAGKHAAAINYSSAVTVTYRGGGGVMEKGGVYN